jgi:hypothetical protein
MISKQMTLWEKIKQNYILPLVLVGASSIGCDRDDLDDFMDIIDPSPYSNMSLEEVIDGISTPREAQDYMNYEIDYADEDTGGARPKDLNGSSRQSFRKTFERGRGVCRDTSVGIAAMLQDDGWPSKILGVHWYKGSEIHGHSVFVYQGEDGKWGSAGGNPTDFREPVCKSVEEIAHRIVARKGGEFSLYHLQDVSLLDLVEGTTKGFVRVTPFVIEKDFANDDNTYTGSVSKIGGGYEVVSENNGTNSDWIKTSRYTEDMFDDSFYQEQWDKGESEPKHTMKWEVLERGADRLPIEEKEDVTTIYGSEPKLCLRKSRIETVYDALKRKEFTVRETRTFKEEKEIEFRLTEKTYHADEVNFPHVETIYTDLNLDGNFDSIRRLEYDVNGFVVSDELEWLDGSLSKR